MAIVRWNPTRELSHWADDFAGLQREVNRLYDQVFRGDAQDDGTLGLSYWTPAVDIADHDNEYVVKVELPGVNKDNVKVTLESNILTIKGEKKQEKEVKENQYHSTERTYGSFQRSFTLPTSVKSSEIEAVFKDGILSITLPKAEEAKPKQIEVKVK